MSRARRRSGRGAAKARWMNIGDSQLAQHTVR
jgi:hypothetical protein